LSAWEAIRPSFYRVDRLPDPFVGKVYLVGAGPGDPKLLTLRAAEVLAAADVVLYDGLANLDLQDFLRARFIRENGRNLFSEPQAPEPSALAAGFNGDIKRDIKRDIDGGFDGAINPKLQPEASAYGSEWISVGKHGSQRIWKQSEINDAIVYHAKLGKTVVRLKGGDTGIFARTGEELERLVSEEIPFEVVPGITAASAVAAYAGIPITHRDWASAVALVTGHSQPSDGGPESDESFDWDSMAKFPGTIVIYMGVTTVGEWSRRLILAGKSQETPVALVRRCSWSDQEIVLCNLGEASEKMTPASKFRPPVLVVIGPVAHLGETFNWFQKRPLFGKQILLCRPKDDFDTTAEQLEMLGATVFSQPALNIEPPENWLELDCEIKKLSQYQWVIFSSRHGVRSFLDRIHTLGKDARVLGNCRLAGVGPSIREELAKYQLRADLIADPPFGAKSLAEGIFASLAEGNTTASESPRFLLIGNNRSDPFLGEQLTSHGFQVTSVIAYRTTPVPSPAPAIAEKLKSGSIDYCLATSPTIARILIEWFGKELAKTRIASISPAVTACFDGIELRNVLEAKEASMAGILSAIESDTRLELDKTAEAS